MSNRNIFRNNKKMIDIGTKFWTLSDEMGLSGIVGSFDKGIFTTSDGHKFTNFSCCSYLDLDQHPDIINGAIQALKKYGVLDHCTPRTRVQMPALLELEDNLSDLFKVQSITSISASVATSSILPLIASGHLTDDQRPLMVFDKNCHLSMLQAKPICADETDVVTCGHHDLDFLEDSLKKNKKVVYVTDGADSLGGYAPVKDLTSLQNKYGLHIYYDDSHSLSAYGEFGKGYVLSNLPEIDEKTIIVATLNKAFGASGATLMFGKQNKDSINLVHRFAGALAYSQPMNIPAIGACIASAELHRTEELVHLQSLLQRNIGLFDSLVSTSQFGSSFPIRLVSVPDTKVIEIARNLFEAGFYVSPVFFPVVKRGSAGMRVMLRASHTVDQIQRLAKTINSHLKYSTELNDSYARQ